HFASQHLIALQVATDLTLSKTVDLVDVQGITPLDIQFEFLQAAQKMAQNVALGEEKSEIIFEWERALTDLEAKGGEGLLDRADWPMRLRVLERHRDGGRYDHDADYRWDVLNDSGYGMQLRNKLWQRWMPDEQL